MDESEIIEGLKIICQCKAIRKRTFLGLMASGHVSLEALQRATGAGSGDCQGKRCTPRIEALLAQHPAAGEKTGH